MIKTLMANMVNLYPDIKNIHPTARHHTKVLIQRSKNMITMISLVAGIQVMKINIIMKGYKTYSEVLHATDIDCCCVGWDSQDVWITERGRFSLYRGYNTVNLELLSTSYEKLLCKYGTFGVSINVPDITLYDIRYDWMNNLNTFEYGKDKILSITEKMIKYFDYMKTNHGITVTLEMINMMNNLYDQINILPDDIEPRHQSDYDISVLYGLNLIMYLKLRYKTDTEGEYMLANLSSHGIDNNEELGGYVYYFNEFTSSTTRDPKIWTNLEPILDRGEFVSTDELQVNNPFKRSINRISQTINPQKNVIQLDPQEHVIQLLSIPEYDYELMTVFGSIEIPRIPEFVTHIEGDRTMGMFHNFIYIDESNWYIGPFVTLK